MSALQLQGPAMQRTDTWERTHLVFTDFSNQAHGQVRPCAAMHTNVAHRCALTALCTVQIYYPDEEDAGDGQWWSGSVAADMLEPEEAQAALQDAWSCEGLWERFVVHWAEPPVRGSSARET